MWPREMQQPRHKIRTCAPGLLRLNATKGRLEVPGSVPPVDPLLVITNSGAGTADQEALDLALAILRDGASVEVAATSNPGELDGVLHRAGSRRIVVAGGDGSLHAVVSALHRRNELTGKVLGLLPLGTGNDFARSAGIPLDVEGAARLVLDGEVRPVDLIVDETRRGRRQQRARRRERPGQPAGPPLEEPPPRHRHRQGQPRQARLPDRRCSRGVPAAPAAPARRGRRRRRRTTWTTLC